MTKDSPIRPRVVLLIRNAYSFDFGGGERIPVSLAGELKKHDLRPIVISRSSKLLSYAKEHGITAYKGWWWSRQDWSGKRTILLPVYFCWQVLLFFWYIQLILRTSAQVIHPQSKDDFIAATLAARLLKRTVVWSDYADLKYVYMNNSIWYKNPVGKIVLFLSRYATSVILTSQSDKRLIEKSLGYSVPNNYVVIYLGVTAHTITPHKRSKADESSIIFVATSRLVTAKGIGELIEAFAQTKKAAPNAQLWLFGEGPEEEQFKAKAKDIPGISFKGFPDDSLRWVASCDVFVHPSYHEGFSISLIEAAKLALPIIACNVGGNPELIKDGYSGLLVPAKDSMSLAAAMITLAEDSQLRKRYGNAVHKKYLNDLVFENIVERKLLPLYE